MSSEVLHQYYVDFIQRGVQQAGQDLKNVQQNADKTTASYRKMRDEIQSVGQMAQRTPIQRGGGGGFTGFQQAAASPTGGTGGISAAGVPKAKPIDGDDLGGFKGMAANAAIATASIGGLTTALTAIAGLTKRGFEGTVEIEQFGRSIMMFARELANVAAPALQLATRLINGLTSTFRGLGGMGQTMIGRGFFGPIGYLIEVLKDPAVQQAGAQLAAAVGRVVEAMKPLWTISINLGSQLLKTFVVGPLVDFANKLTVALLIFEKMARVAGQVAGSVLKLTGLGNLTKPIIGERSELRLNQTGTEDAEGTFQRIQQEILKSAMPEVEDPTLGKLTEIYNRIDTFFTFVEFAVNKAQGGASDLVDSVQGAGTQGVRRLGRGLFGLLGM